MAIIQTLAENIGHKPRTGSYKLIVEQDSGSLHPDCYLIMEPGGQINAAWGKPQISRLIGILNRRELKRQGVDILITEVEWRG